VTTANDHVLARELAEQAGRRLLELRAGGGEPDMLRKAGDRQSHEFLAAELAARRPGDILLSEEAADDKARLTADRVWIVDPLDGTREFGEPGRTDWAVHVALWERAGGGGLTAGAREDVTGQDGTVGGLTAGAREGGRQDQTGALTAGAVALPAQGRVLSTGAEIPSSYADHPAGDRRVRIVVSRSRAPRLVLDISDLIDAELVPLGSAGAKVAAVVSGEADAYVHGGGFYEWDTAAPVAVARAAGFHASRIDGSPLLYNQADLLVPDILVCRPALAGTLLKAIREVTNAC